MSLGPLGVDKGQARHAISNGVVELGVRGNDPRVDVRLVSEVQCAFRVIHTHCGPRKTMLRLPGGREATYFLSSVAARARMDARHEMAPPTAGSQAAVRHSSHVRVRMPGGDLRHRDS